MGKYYGNYKIKCPCGYEGISFQYGGVLECPECENTDNITVLPVEQWNANEIVDAWSSDLEGDNYHSWTSMPDRICTILEKHIEDKNLIKNIMYDLYKDGLQ